MLSLALIGLCGIAVDQDVAKELYHQCETLFDASQVRSGIVDLWVETPFDGTVRHQQIWFRDDKYRFVDERNYDGRVYRGYTRPKSTIVREWYNGQFRAQTTDGMRDESTPFMPDSGIRPVSGPASSFYDRTRFVYDNLRTAGFWISQFRSDYSKCTFELEHQTRSDGIRVRLLTITFSQAPHRIVFEFPEKGPATPLSRISIRPDGKQTMRFFASGWIESNGVFLPKEWTFETTRRGRFAGNVRPTPEQIRESWESPEDPGWDTGHTRVVSAEFNMPIPDEAFETTLPQGIRVQDDRFRDAGGHPVIYHAPRPLHMKVIAQLTGEPRADELDSLQSDLSRKQGPGRVLMGGLLVLAGVIAALGAWRFSVRGRVQSSPSTSSPKSA